VLHANVPCSVQVMRALLERVRGGDVDSVIAELEEVAAGGGEDAEHAVAALEHARWLHSLNDQQLAYDAAQQEGHSAPPHAPAPDQCTGAADGVGPAPRPGTLKWYIANKHMPVSAAGTITVFEVAYCYLRLKLDGGIPDTVFRMLLNVACNGGLLAQDNIMPRCGPVDTLLHARP
jgi:hypothetical protein